MRCMTRLTVLALSLLLLAGCSGITNGTTTSPSLTPSVAVSPTLDPSVPAPLSIYVALGGVVTALNATDGTVRWRYTISGNASSPTLANGVVYVSSDNQHVYALNANSGTLLWQAQIMNLLDDPVAERDGSIYVHSTDHHLYALSPKDGSVRWRSEKDGDVIFDSAGVAYVRSDQLYALHTSDGSVRWSHPLTGDSTLLWISAEKQVYLVEEQVQPGGFAIHILHVLNADTGKEQWRFSAGKTQLQLVGIDNGSLYLTAAQQSTSTPNVVYALNTNNGSIRWQSHFSNVGAVPGTLANQIIYLGSTETHMVYAVNAGDGSLRWQKTVGSVTPVGNQSYVVTVTEGLVYVWSFNNGLFALNASDGSVAWQHQTTDDIRVSAVVNGEIVGYTADRNTAHTINNYIYALTASDGSMRWRYDTGTSVPAITIG